MTPEVRALGHTPEARKKAVETMRRNRLKKLAEKQEKIEAKRIAKSIKIPKNAKRTTFDISALPPRPQKKVKEHKRTRRTIEEKARIVQRVNALLAKGRKVREALDAAGVGKTQYSDWTKRADVRRAMKGAPVTKLNGHASSNYIVSSRYDPIARAMAVNISINGQEHIVTPEEALALRVALGAMGF